jgi:type VI secretion system secreted protein Hcp
MSTIFLKFDDIKGNSTIDGYTDQIILTSMQFGVGIGIGADTGNTERTIGRPSFSELTVTKEGDKSTAGLLAACAAGTKLGLATIEMCRNEGGKLMSYQKFELSDAMISSVSLSSGGDNISESISINYTQIKMTYTQQKKDSTKSGTADFGWDLSTNKPV